MVVEGVIVNCRPPGKVAGRNLTTLAVSLDRLVRSIALVAHSFVPEASPSVLLARPSDLGDLNTLPSDLDMHPCFLGSRPSYPVEPAA